MRNRQNGKAMKGRGNVVPRRRRCRLGRRLGRRYEYLEGTPGEIPHTIFPPLPLNISSTGDQYPFVSPALSACMRVVRTSTGPPPYAKSPGRLESWSNARGCAPNTWPFIRFCWLRLFRLFRLFKSSLFETEGRTCKRGTVQLARTRDTPRAKQSYTENFHRTSHTAHHLLRRVGRLLPAHSAIGWAQTRRYKSTVRI